MQRLVDDRLPLVSMGILLAIGGLVLAGGTVGLAGSGLHTLLSAYGLFAVAFTIGTFHHYQEQNRVGTAGHAIAVVGWMTGMVGHAIGGVTLIAFSLGFLFASGIALFLTGLKSGGLLGEAIP